MPDSLTQNAPHPEVIAIRSYLTFAAHHRQLVTPAQVVGATGTAKSRLVQRLDELNRLEHATGRPILGAIVTQGSSGRPSAGFLRFAREVWGASTDEQSMWQTERDRVWAFDWSD
jgi:hypothetical protein